MATGIVAHEKHFNIQVSPGPPGCKKGSVHVEYRIIQLSVLDKLFKCPMT